MAALATTAASTACKEAGVEGIRAGGAFTFYFYICIRLARVHTAVARWLQPPFFLFLPM
jgi:hypothetical protein